MEEVGFKSSARAIKWPSPWYKSKSQLELCEHRTSFLSFFFINLSELPSEKELTSDLFQMQISYKAKITSSNSGSSNINSKRKIFHQELPDKKTGREERNVSKPTRFEARLKSGDLCYESENFEKW